MPIDCISFQESGYFTPLINDYLDRKPHLEPLYNRFPILENFEPQLLEKQQNFDDSTRQILVEVLQRQYVGIEMSALTRQNISALAKPNSFTVTTGHQLNLFTGPLYFLYKIISTINLTTELKTKYPNYNFIPVYWMATEDHDFEEINFFNFKGKKFRWNRKSSGPVGRLSTEGLEEVFDIFALELGSSHNAEAIKKLFKSAYLEHDNLTAATRFLANVLFESHGLVILDADDRSLKKLFIPYIKEELLQQTSHKSVLETIPKLKDYGVQVNPREINLFYIEDNLRERIINVDDIYCVNNTDIKFTAHEMLSLLENEPEKFSPNAILRPLYQEVILPNLCYIGGGGELAYWFELKSLFESASVTFPILLLRNSVLIATPKQALKADKLGLNWKELFLKQQDLLNVKVGQLSEFPIELSIQKDHLKSQFHFLHLIAEQTDKSFASAVKAQEAKQINGLENLEKRLLKAQKRKHNEILERVTELQNQLFPHQALQERQINFSELYVENGTDLIEKLFSTLKPFGENFDVVIL